MGSQQLLLVVVGLVVVGIMVIVGVTTFKDQAAATNRDELVNDLGQYASRAQVYYRRPTVFAGGGTSFNGLTMLKLTNTPTTLNGTCSLSPEPVGGDPPFVTLTGIGTETGVNGTENVKVVMFVYPDSIRVDVASGN
jgi:hypothetical protein